MDLIKLEHKNKGSFVENVIDRVVESTFFVASLFILTVHLPNISMHFFL